jgi:D-aspartate ligase
VNFPDRQHVGALVVGGDHPGLGVARSLGRRGIPVYVVEDQFSVCDYSRYAKKVIRVKDIRDEDATAEAVLEVGKQYGLQGWVLIPTRDETVAAFSRHRVRLEKMFRMTTQEWDVIQWAWDKNKTYKFAEKHGIPVPGTWTVRNADELESLFPRLPLAIKPAIKENFFYATGAKAWRANTPAELRDLFNRAAEQIPCEEIMIQEIVPGDGSTQLSWCAFVVNGEAHSTLVAKRLRQHPREFGRAATYVETVECPEVEELSKIFVKALGYHGLIEIEYKFDHRDGKYKLLDANARAWGFHSLGWVAGVDFPYLMFADQFGESAEPARAKAGVGWLRIVTDVPTVVTQVASGYLPIRDYISSLKHARMESIFVMEDPLPSVAEIAMLPYLVFKKYFAKEKAQPGQELQANSVQPVANKNDI